jgi:rare lipoprotein A
MAKSMRFSWSSPLLGALGILFLLFSGCNTPPLLKKIAHPHHQADQGPIGSIPALASIHNLTPKKEPLSRWGNPPSYTIRGKKYHVLSSSKNYTATGLASWYGQKFHGRLTANGEHYNMHALTAAHRSLPLPTYVRVENLENGKKIIVRINDRGPFPRGKNAHKRIIDLSYSAARKLDMHHKGTAQVRITALNPVQTRRKTT